MGIFLDAGRDERVPVSLLTGFLGSGKTTLLNRLVRQEEMANAAVLINEFGDVALDQHFVEKKQDDVLVMPSGCLCCSAQGDFEGVIGALYGRRLRGEIKPFDRLVIETSGLADPTTIIELLLASPLVVQFFALEAVITTVDAVHGLRQLREHREALVQAAVADRLLLTKTDLASPGEADELRLELSAINTAAPVFEVRHGELPARALFGAGPAGEGGPERWLGRLADMPGAERRHAGVATFALACREPLQWAAFSRWLTRVRIRYSEQLLRVKGLVNVQGESRPVAIHGVHHVFHPPARLERSFGEDACTRLVFIVQGDLRSDITRDWLQMLREAQRPVERSTPA